jgi:hypothetical protein
MHFAESSGVGDKSFEWIKSMSVVKPELPCSNDHVTKVLFPNVHGKFPVTKQAYHFFSSVGFRVKEYLEEADGSLVPILVSGGLNAYCAPLLSEMYTTSCPSNSVRSLPCFKLIAGTNLCTLWHTIVTKRQGIVSPMLP